jgi:hypothetical protein
MSGDCDGVGCKPQPAVTLIGITGTSKAEKHAAVWFSSSCYTMQQPLQSRISTLHTSNNDRPTVLLRTFCAAASNEEVDLPPPARFMCQFTQGGLLKGEACAGHKELHSR